MAADQPLTLRQIRDIAWKERQDAVRELEAASSHLSDVKHGSSFSNAEVRNRAYARLNAAQERATEAELIWNEAYTDWKNAGEPFD